MTQTACTNRPYHRALVPRDKRNLNARDAVPGPASHRRVRPIPARGRGGFTLIELLVVIAIIAILAAILFPVLARARAQGQRATCLSNLRQIGNAARMYADDHDGTMPPGHAVSSGYGAPTSPTYWFAAMEPFLKSRELVRCPADRDATEYLPSRPTETYANAYEEHEDEAVYSSYLLNGVFTDSVDGRRQRLHGLRHPADTILFVERDTRRLSQLGWSNDDDYHPWETALDDEHLPVYWGPNGGMAAERHAGGAVYAYADGHVAWRRFSETFIPGGRNQHLP